MKAGLFLYARFSMVFILLASVVGFHFAVRGLGVPPLEPRRQVPVAVPTRGPALIQAYGCGACHRVPGVPLATGTVGPRLDQLNNKVYIAGILPGSPQNLTVWIMNPQEISPRTAMPDLDVSEQDARDIAAYLYSLE